MRSEAPALLPILRSRHLAEVLTLLLLHPDTEYSLSEVAATLGQPLTTVQREAARLAGAGLIRERRVGRARLVSADPAGPLHPAAVGTAHPGVRAAPGHRRG